MNLIIYLPHLFMIHCVLTCVTLIQGRTLSSAGGDVSTHSHSYYVITVTVTVSLLRNGPRGSVLFLHDAVDHVGCVRERL